MNSPTRHSSDVGLGSSLNPTVIDFFSGCGGTSTGLQAAGMRIAAAIDFDSEAAATFRANFPNTSFHEADIRELQIDAFDHLAGLGTPLVFSACAPCQPYSTMRPSASRARHRERSLLLTLLPFIDRLEPDVILVENVPGLQKVTGGSTWNRFLAHIRRAGYTPSWKIIDCRDYGVPQRRKRLVLLASRHGSIDIPSATHGTDTIPYTTVRDYIGHLRPLRAGETDHTDPIHRCRSLGDLNLRRISALPDGGSRSQWPQELWLDCHRNSKGHQDTYGRMRYDATAPVLTTKCTDLTNGRYGHPVQDRAISAREAALLQTFPPKFQFLGSLRSVSKQIGNAVPVLVAKTMGMQIIHHLDSELAQ